MDAPEAPPADMHAAAAPATLHALAGDSEWQTSSDDSDWTAEEAAAWDARRPGYTSAEWAAGTDTESSESESSSDEEEDDDGKHALNCS